MSSSNIMESLRVWWIVLLIVRVFGQSDNIQLVQSDHTMTSENAEHFCRRDRNGQIISDLDILTSEEIRKDLSRLFIESATLPLTWIGSTNRTLHGCEQNKCRNGGQCIKNNTEEVCICPARVPGQSCDQQDCTMASACKSRGTCEGNECKCTDNSRGKFCKYDQGCTESRCHNNGTCVFNGQNVFCMCEYPYLGRNCTLKDYQFVGCFNDTADRLLNASFYLFNTTNSPYRCVTKCASLGFLYAGLQYKTQCFCGDFLNASWVTNERYCHDDCPGNKSAKCGGNWALSVYNITKQDFSNESDSKNEDNLTCTFDPVDPCFLRSYDGDGFSWQHNYSAGYPDSGHLMYLPGFNESGAKAILGAPVPLTIPRCLLISYFVKNGSNFSIYLTNSDSLEDKDRLNFTTVYNRWTHNAKVQLLPTFFASILIVGHSGSEVSIGNVQLRDGYCDCTSSECFPGMFCNRSSGKECCSNPDECTVYQRTPPDLGTLKCTYTVDAPCFMDRGSGIWKRDQYPNETGISGLLWSRKTTNTTKVTDVVSSIVLPADKDVCFTFDFSLFGNSSIHVLHSFETNREESLSIVNSVIFPQKITFRIIIALRTRTNSKVKIKGTLYDGDADSIYIDDVEISNGLCDSKVTICNRIIKMDEGVIAPNWVSKNTCIWNISVSEGAAGILLQIMNDHTNVNCSERSLEITYGQTTETSDICGRNITINETSVSLRLINGTKYFKARWKQLVRFCPALYLRDSDVEIVGVPCHEKLQTVCQRPVDESTPQTFGSDSSAGQSTGNTVTVQNSLTDDTPNVLVIIAVAAAAGVLLIIAAVLVLVIVLRRRSKVQKNMVAENFTSNPQTNSTGIIGNSEQNWTDSVSDNRKEQNNTEFYDHLELKTRNAARTRDAEVVNDTENIYDKSEPHTRENENDLYDHAERKRTNENDFSEVYDTAGDIRKGNLEDMKNENCYSSTQRTTSDKDRTEFEESTYDSSPSYGTTTGIQGNDGTYDHVLK